MVGTERVRRPFWIHQVIEYVIGIALISSSVQLPDPAVPALLGLLIILNAAVARGSAGAFRLVGRRLHRTLDLVVIAILTFFAVQPWWPLDTTSRMLIGSIAFILCFVWFYTDFAEQRSPSERKAQRTAERVARGPTDSAELGRRAGRLVGGTVNSAKRWKDGLSETAVAENAVTETRPPNQWDPPTSAQ
ncbi:MAG TPA: hypothetical protein VES40_15290 [Ilumatobacteraceae bacterium]|nr:hypothetical protein [Ilumatobacteraceae bacterium]